MALTIEGSRSAPSGAVQDNTRLRLEKLPVESIDLSRWRRRRPSWQILIAIGTRDRASTVAQRRSTETTAIRFVCLEVFIPIRDVNARRYPPAAGLMPTAVTAALPA